MLRVAALAAAIPLGMLAEPVLAQDPFKTKSIPISRADTAHEWPFTVDHGELTCFIFGPTRLVLFAEPDRNDPDWFIKNLPYQSPRTVIVSVNPLEIFASVEDASLYAPFDSDFVVLIRRLTPFVKMGQALCDELQAEPKADIDGDIKGAEDGGNAEGK